MKKKLIAFALLFAGITSCSNDEEIIKKNTDYAEPGTAVLVSKFYSVNDASTKADPVRTAAYEVEKEIKSIAFFVQIEGNTDIQLFESEKIIGAPDGLLEALNKTDIGKYTAKFKMLMTGDHKVNMFALGNYKENGLNLSTITTVDKLKDAATNAITNQKNPERPLLMLGTTTVEKLKEGEAKEIAFKMDRLVARVDVINEAFNTNAAKGFRFVSAQVLNGKEKTMLLPDNYTAIDAISIIPEMDKKSEVKLIDIDGKVTAVEADALVQRLDTLYMFENRNGSETAGTTAATGATAIQINGTFNGTPVSQRIDFMKEDPKTGVKSRLAIARNNLYTIRIRPSQDSTTLSFDITIKDWTTAKGDTMLIDLKKEKPTLSVITSTGLVGATLTGKRIDITATANLAGTITFTASGTRDSKHVISYVGRKNAAWMDGDVVVPGPLTGYTKAATTELKREYTIDLSKAKTELAANSKVPSDAFVIIQNANDATLSDTIQVCFRPDYNGLSGLKPVLFKGQFWAPVNVGATKIPTAVTTTWDQATCGKYYQWGRNYAFNYNSLDIVQGPVAYNTIQPGGDNESKFILGVKDLSYEWLVSGDPSTEIRNTLWSIKVNDSPCPDGWRVPIDGELSILEEMGKALSIKNGCLSIPSDMEPATSLVLPAAGMRYDTGVATNIVTAGQYWSSDKSGNRAVSFNFNTATIAKTTNVTSNGHSIRCIQK